MQWSRFTTSPDAAATAAASGPSPTSRPFRTNPATPFLFAPPRQVEICGKLTWTRTDCYNGITSIKDINGNTVAQRQRQAALKVWQTCNVDKKSLDLVRHSSCPVVGDSRLGHASHRTGSPSQQTLR